MGGVKIQKQLTPRKSSVSVQNFFRKYECISSCNLPISSNLLKNSIRKTSFFVLFELLSMYDLLLPHRMNGLIILPVFVVRTLMKKQVSWYKLGIQFNPLSASMAKWSNTLKQFVSSFLTNCLSVFDLFVRLVLKGLRHQTDVTFKSNKYKNSCDVAVN